MANHSITSMFALHNHQLVAAEGEHRNLDWEVVEMEDLYTDVDSLESFSISSGDIDDGQEQESEGGHANHVEIHGLLGDCSLAVHVLGQYVEVTRSELHRDLGDRELLFGDVSLYSENYNADDAEFEEDVVGEPNRGVVPLVDPLEFQIECERSVVVYHHQCLLDHSIDKEDVNGIGVQDDYDDDDDDGTEYEIDV